jgi:hypothetical protein
MEKEKKYTPQHISDRIIQDFIDQLLRVGEEYKKEIKHFNPYSLDSKRTFNLEANFKNGVKSAPSATKKLKPAAHSVFEFEMMRNVGDEIEVPQVLGSTYVPIKIHGRIGDYYIRTSLLRNLMSEFLYETTVGPCKGGERFVARFYIDTKLLNENCVRRK